MVEKVIFTIDDSELFQYYLKGYLRNYLMKKAAALDAMGQPTRYRIFQFANGQEALKQLRRKPDLVLLDYYLEADEDGETRNGDWVFSELKHYSPNTEIVLLTSASEPEVMVRMVKLGMRHYVLKDLNHMQELNQYL